MDNQDQRRTHAQGHVNHGGVLVCHKCGCPFPNPHPSAKLRRAHKKICGSIEGYQVSLLVSEGQTHSNPSDDEQHLSDDDHKIQQGLNTLDTNNNDKDSDGIGEKSIRSGDEVFSDAVAEFLDGGLTPGVKEHLQNSLGSAADMEVIQRKYPEFSGSSAGNGYNDESQLITKSRNDGRMQNPEALHCERAEDGAMLKLQGQLSSSSVNPFESSSEDLENEELTVLRSNGCLGLRSDLKPSKSEAMPDVLLEKASDSSLTSISKETTLEEKDEFESDRDFVEIVVSSINTVGEMCERVSKIAVADVVSSSHQVVGGDFKPKEKNGAEFPSVMPRDDFPLEVNSAVSTNASVHMIELATSSDVKVLQEREEGNVNVFTLHSGGDRPDVPHPQSEYEDCEGMVSQNSSSQHSSKELLQERDDFLKDSVSEEIDSLINQSQFSEKREVLSEDEDVHALNSSMKMEQVKCEFIAEQMHTEGSVKVLPGRASKNAMKTEMNESHIVYFSEEQASDVVPKNSQHISSSYGSFMVTSNENSSDTSFRSATSETTTVISRVELSHHDKNITRINDIAVDGKCGGANTGDVTGISITTLQSSILYSEIKPSSVYISVDTVEMGKFEKCDKKDTQNTERSIVKDTTPPASSNFESPILSEVETDGPATRSKEDCNQFAGTTAEIHQAQDEKLLRKATEGLVRDHLSDPYFPQHASAVEETEDEEPEGTKSGTGNNDINSSAINTSVGPGCRCDSLETNWGSVSVLSVQPDAQATIEAEALPSTDLLPSSEAEKSNMKGPEVAATESKQRETTELFEPPSFMTLVEPGNVVHPKHAASEHQTESNKEHLNSTCSQAGWFPTLSHVTNESQGRKRNEAIIAEVTNHRSTIKEQHTPLKSLLGEAAAHNSKPKSPKLEKNPANQKNGKVPAESRSGLTTVNSIPAPESPAALKGEATKEWNSPAKYPADIKREKKKTKSRPFSIPFVCCSSMDTR